MKAVAAVDKKIQTITIEEPNLIQGHVLIRTEFSAISPGTEMGMLKNSKDQPIIMGYSAVGIIESVSEGITHLQPGQRVACYGAPYVRHTELLTVPANLVAPVPDHVKPEEAAFAGLGAIAIHALRTADLRFGENVVVVGLGILGNLIAQISAAVAYQTLGLDLNEKRVQLLQQIGIEQAYSHPNLLEDALREKTGGVGADSVLLCIAGPGEEPINQAIKWIRDRGKIVIVGDISAEFSRGLMFGKEAQVLISRAGGPGRYDANYELHNMDYPIGYVRWTEGRNVGEYIRLLAEKRITLQPLITDIFPVDRAAEAYENYKASPSVLGTLIQYR